MRIRMGKFLKIKYSKISFIPDLVSQQKLKILRLRNKPFVVSIGILIPKVFDN